MKGTGRLTGNIYITKNPLCLSKAGFLLYTLKNS